MSPTLSLHLMVRNLPPRAAAAEDRPGHRRGERGTLAAGIAGTRPAPARSRFQRPHPLVRRRSGQRSAGAGGGSGLEPDEPAGRRPRRAHAAYRGAGVGGKRGGTADSPRLPGAGRRLPGSGLHRPGPPPGGAGAGGAGRLRAARPDRVDPLLFESMPWGGDRLLALTCERLRQLGWEHHLLPALWDVDRPEDLPRLAALGLVL